MRIALDANAFVGDFSMRGSAFRVLSQVIHLGHPVFVPQLVVDETLNAHSAGLLAVVEKVQSAERELSRLSANPLPQSYDQAWAASAAAEYEEHLTDWLRTRSVTVLPYPTIDHASVAARAIHRKKPFSERGAGYRDYLIWLSVLDLAEASPEPLVFVTSNTKDFALNEDLHPDLLEDLASRGIDGARVVLAAGMDVLRKDHLQPLLPSLDEIREQLAAGTYRPFDLKDRLPVLIQEAASGGSWDARDVGLPDEAESVDIEGVYEPTEVEVGRVSELSDSEIIIDVDFAADCDLDFFIFKGAIYDAEREDYHILEFDWNKHYARAEASRSLWFTVSLTFDRTSAEVTSVDIEDVNLGPIGPE